MSDVGALKFAAELGDLEAVKRLVEGEKVPVDQPDQFGDTALHAACAQGRDEIVEYLLAQNADPNVRNKSGSTPLHKLVTSKHEKEQVLIVRRLLKKKADPTIRNTAGLLAEQLTTRKMVLGEIYGDDAVNEEVSIPKAKHGRVIGKGGAKLREIQDESCTVITVPKQNEPTNNMISVFGRPVNVEKAKKLINAAVADQQRGGGDMQDGDEEGSGTVTKFPVPKHLHSHIIGKRGKTINDIRDETGVQITVPRFEDPDSNLILKGEVDDIDAAIKRILQITKAAQEVSYNSPRGRGNGYPNNNRRGGYNNNYSNDNGQNRGPRQERRDSHDSAGSSGSAGASGSGRAGAGAGAPAVDGGAAPRGGGVGAAPRGGGGGAGAAPRGGGGGASRGGKSGGRAGRVTRLELGTPPPTERELSRNAEREFRADRAKAGSPAAPRETKETTEPQQE